MSGNYPKREIVKELQYMIENKGWRQDFVEALIKVKEILPEVYADIKTVDPLDSDDGFYKWLDDYVHWAPDQNTRQEDVYNHICAYYFIFSQPSVARHQTKEEPGKHDIQPKATDLSSWMRKFTESLGEFLDTPESLAKIKGITKIKSFNTSDCITGPSGWRTFNQFFARQLKPGVRPIEKLWDDKSIISPVDGAFQNCTRIMYNSKVRSKGFEWSIKQLLTDPADPDACSNYWDRFKNGVFMNIFLQTEDYHRWHVPVGGIIRDARVIRGLVYVEVNARKDRSGFETTIAGKKQFEASANVGYQFAQTRGLVIIESSIGLVALLPIGLGHVASVVVTAEAGVTLRKGEEFGYFQFGGSDFIVLFEQSANVKIFAQKGNHYNMGQWIGDADI